jgi:L-malate glycosyltransferase
MKILHLCPHLGGGLKTVLLGWISKDLINEHCIVSLGYADRDVNKICNENNVDLYCNFLKGDYELIINLIPQYDIIIIHYWNFPLLLDFLVNNPLPECRLITWFHNSGFYDPYSLPKNIIEMSDRMVFTSPISYDLPICKYLLPKFESQLFDIWSTGGVDKYLKIKKKDHKGFNILYVGTVDFSKLREDFIYICYTILKEIPEATITICGDGASKKELEYSVKELGLENKIIFKGLISDLIPFFETADIFLYPLTSTHYGTCEQILGELMAAGIIPIVFNNKAEMKIVTNEVDGFVVSSIEECVNRVKELYEDREDGLSWSQLSLNAKLTAQEKYSIDKMINKWNNLFEEVIKLNKKEKQWKSDFIYIYDIETIPFLESLDYDNARLFHEYISYERKIKQLLNSNLQWQSQSKGSINQYLKYFPNDRLLQKFKDIMNESM